MSKVIYSGSTDELRYPGMSPVWSQDQIDRARTILKDAHFQEDSEVIEGADIEDFWEGVARIAAARLAAIDHGLEFELVDPFDISLDDTMNHRLGPIYRVEEARHGVSKLANHSLLMNNSGRTMIESTHYDESPEDGSLGVSLFDAVLKTADSDGNVKVVIKAPGSKNGVYLLELEQATEQSVQHEVYANDLGHFIHLYSDMEGVFIVQQWVSMEYEYRMFIVDGEVITGAGCIEEFTPLDRRPEDGPFSPLMRRHRRYLSDFDDSPIVENHDMLALYKSFMDDIKDQYAGMTVVIDLAYNPDSESVIVVEMNTLPNSGLYASDVNATYSAIAVAQNHGYEHYSLISELKIGRNNPFERTETSANSEILEARESVSDERTGPPETFFLETPEVFEND